MKIGEYYIDEHWTTQVNCLVKRHYFKHIYNAADTTYAGEISVTGRIYEHDNYWDVRIDVLWKEYDSIFGVPRSSFRSAEDAMQSIDLFLRKLKKLKAFI